MKVFQLTVVLIVALMTPHLCLAYKVAPALTLDELVQESDVIFKAKVLSSTLVEDSWFEKQPGFDSFETKMEVIAFIKGEAELPMVRFQHYGPAQDPDNMGSGFGPPPQSYNLTAGRSYIILAKETGREGVFRQLWKRSKLKSDQGAFLTDDRPVAADISVKEIIWSELNRHLTSPDTEDVIYAIRQLDEMSRSFGWQYRLDDFDRALAMQAVHPFVISRDEAVAKRAIEAVGARSPYLSDDEAAHWLATVGGGQIRGLAKRDVEVQNTSARKYQKQLTAAAETDHPPAIRALAVRALGRAGEPGLLADAVRWSEDPNPLVRQAAIILLADFPGEETRTVLERCSNDEAPEVRIGVARAVGFGQSKQLLPLLAGLLEDEEPQVSTAAALSLVSFSPADAGHILQTNAEHPDFRSVFVNALAETDPQPYLAALADIIENRLEPEHFWGGTIPYARSWRILFAHVKRQDKDTLMSAALARCLDALENAKFHGSGEPRNLYALYMQQKMLDRARSFRMRCQAKMDYMDYYFDMVDEDPAAYLLD